MRYHSSGTFTLDPRRALERLGQCTLSDPHLALVKVVQSALAGGATRVVLEVDAFGASAEYDGPPLRAADLRELRRFLLEEGPLRELAVAVFAALGTVARQVEIGSGSVRCVWTAEGPWLGAGGNPGLGNHVRLTRNLRSLSDLVRGWTCPEVRLLRERCRYAPVPVILNGRRLSQLTLGAPGEHLEERYLLAEEGLLAPTVSYAEQPPRLPSRCLAGSHVPCRAVLARRRGGAGSVAFLRHGVVVAGQPLAHEGVLALLSCEGLSLDLSGFAVVHDEALEQRMAWLEQELAGAGMA